MQHEYVPIVSITGDNVGEAMRHVAEERGLPHPIVGLLLADRFGRLMIPTASHVKDDSGRLYHLAAGHVRLGESREAACVREGFEELGLTIQLHELKEICSYWLARETSAHLPLLQHFTIFLSRVADESVELELNQEQILPRWINLGDLVRLSNRAPYRFSLPLIMTLRLAEDRIIAAL